MAACQTDWVNRYNVSSSLMNGFKTPTRSGDLVMPETRHNPLVSLILFSSSDTLCVDTDNNENNNKTKRRSPSRHKVMLESRTVHPWLVPNEYCSQFDSLPRAEIRRCPGGKSSRPTTHMPCPGSGPRVSLATTSGNLDRPTLPTTFGKFVASHGLKSS